MTDRAPAAAAPSSTLPAIRSDYLDQATVYFWDEEGSFSAEQERREFSARCASTPRNRPCRAGGRAGDEASLPSASGR